MSLLDRVKGILFSPRSEWPVIDREPTSSGGLYRGYILPLAAIAPLAHVIGKSVIGIRDQTDGTVYRAPIGSAVTTVLVALVLTLVGVYLLALIINGLAPVFGGTRSTVQALKTAAYSATAAWVAGLFALIPGLGVLGILGLYGFYLMYLGLPVTMKVPADRAGGYTAAVVIASIVLLAATMLILLRTMPVTVI